MVQGPHGVVHGKPASLTAQWFLKLGLRVDSLTVNHKRRLSGIA